jgi:Tfp pilus assembly protein PilX
VDSAFFLFVGITIMIVVAVVVLSHYQNQERMKSNARRRGTPGL